MVTLIDTMFYGETFEACFNLNADQIPGEEFEL